MTVYSVFAQASLGSTLVSDDQAQSMGMQFTLSADATLTGIWFFTATGAAKLPAACCIYQVTGSGTGTVVSGTANTSPTWSGAAGSNAWVKCSFDGSVTLTAGVNYKVVVAWTNTVQNVYSIPSANYWSSGPGASGVTNGIITAPNNAGADGGQDTFLSGYSSGNPGYPTGSFNANNYGIDVEVTSIGTDTGPNYAGAASGLAGGSGSWVSPANAQGAADSAFATWTAP